MVTLSEALASALVSLEEVVLQGRISSGSGARKIRGRFLFIWTFSYPIVYNRWRHYAQGSREQAPQSPAGAQKEIEP